MYCKINNQLNIRLLDSLHFPPMALLSQLPKSFGLQELKKGYFPHLYNTPENVDHFDKILPCLPEIKYYDADNMRPSLREDFIQSHDINKNKPFHFHTELLAYCKSDVDILLNACWKFHSLVMDVTGPEHPMDPFNYTTIASICMGIFHSKFLPEKWKVLLQNDAKVGCTHESQCSCLWLNAMKDNGNSPLQI